MLHRGEVGHPLWSSNSLSGRIRTPQLRVIVLELFQLNHELVVLGVGDRWGVVGIVGVLGVQDAFGQLSPAMARLGLGLACLQLIASDGIVNHGPILAQFPYLCIRVSVDLPPTTRCGGRGSSAATGPHSGFQTPVAGSAPAKSPGLLGVTVGAVEEGAGVVGADGPSPDGLTNQPPSAMEAPVRQCLSSSRV